MGSSIVRFLDKLDRLNMLNSWWVKEILRRVTSSWGKFIFPFLFKLVVIDGFLLLQMLVSQCLKPALCSQGVISLQTQTMHLHFFDTPKMGPSSWPLFLCRVFYIFFPQEKGLAQWAPAGWGHSHPSRHTCRKGQCWFAWAWAFHPNPLVPSRQPTKSRWFECWCKICFFWSEYIENEFI